MSIPHHRTCLEGRQTPQYSLESKVCSELIRPNSSELIRPNSSVQGLNLQYHRGWVATLGWCKCFRSCSFGARVQRSDSQPPQVGSLTVLYRLSLASFPSPPESHSLPESHTCYSSSHLSFTHLHYHVCGALPMSIVVYLSPQSFKSPAHRHQFLSPIPTPPLLIEFPLPFLPPTCNLYVSLLMCTCYPLSSII